MDDWRPMETALRDGTHVLLSICDQVNILWWECVDADKYRWQGALRYIPENIVIDGWMPLPEPIAPKTP